eukprot:8164-Heterococcus_DN1.PRE.6
MQSAKNVCKGVSYIIAMWNGDGAVHAQGYKMKSSECNKASALPALISNALFIPGRGFAQVEINKHISSLASARARTDTKVYSWPALYAQMDSMYHSPEHV